MLAGGFGSAVLGGAERRRASPLPRILRVGLPDRYVTHGKPALLHARGRLHGQRDRRAHRGGGRRPRLDARRGVSSAARADTGAHAPRRPSRCSRMLRPPRPPTRACRRPTPSPAEPPAVRPAPAAPSRAVGLPWRGRLVRGVQLPEAGVGYLTWDGPSQDDPQPPVAALGHRSARHAPAARGGRAPGGARVAADRPRRRPQPPARRDLRRALRRPGPRLAPERARRRRALPARRRRARARRGGPTRSIACWRRTSSTASSPRAPSTSFVGPRARPARPARTSSRRLAHHDDHLHVRIARRPSATTEEKRPAEAGRFRGGEILLCGSSSM